MVGKEQWEVDRLHDPYGILGSNHASRTFVCDDRASFLRYAHNNPTIVVRSNLVSTIVVRLLQVKVKVKVNFIELMQHSALYDHPTSFSRNQGSNHYLCIVQHGKKIVVYY